MRSPSILTELVGDTDHSNIWRGWRVSVAVWFGFYTAGAVISFVLMHGSLNAFSAIWLTGVTLMGLLRERGIGSGMLAVFAATQAPVFFFGTWHHDPLGWKVAWSLAFLAAPLVGFAVGRLIRR